MPRENTKFRNNRELEFLFVIDETNPFDETSCDEVGILYHSMLLATHHISEPSKICNQHFTYNNNWIKCKYVQFKLHIEQPCEMT